MKDNSTKCQDNIKGADSLQHFYQISNPSIAFACPYPHTVSVVQLFSIPWKLLRIKVHEELGWHATMDIALSPPVAIVTHGLNYQPQHRPLSSERERGARRSTHWIGSPFIGKLRNPRVAAPHPHPRWTWKLGMETLVIVTAGSHIDHAMYYLSKAKLGECSPSKAGIQHNILTMLTALL